MYEGTLATKGPWQSLVTFQQLIVLANRHGEVDMTADAISRRTTIPLEIIEIGLRELQKPDPDSRSMEEEGRRIVPIEPSRRWGWRLVNYDKYRKIRSEEERREYQRNLMAKRRTKLAPVSNVSPCSMQYVEVDADEKKEKATPCASAQLVPAAVWLAFAEHRKKLRSPLTDRAGELIRMKLAKLEKEGNDPTEVLEQSIEQGWKGVFPIHKENGNGKQPESFAERNIRRADEELSEVSRRAQQVLQKMGQGLPESANRRGGRGLLPGGA